MEVIIIGFLAIGLAIALWKMIRMIVGLALVLFIGYVCYSYKEVPALKFSEDSFLKESVLNSSPVLVNNKNLESIFAGSKIESDRSSISIDVHHYIHNNENEESKYRSNDIQMVVNQRKESFAKEPSLKKVLNEKKVTSSNYCYNMRIQNRRYALVEGIYKSQQAAEDRLKQLIAHRIKGACIIGLPCYESDLGDKGFAIILGRLCRSKRSAEKLKENYSFELYSADIIKQKPLITFIQQQNIEEDWRTNRRVY